MLNVTISGKVIKREWVKRDKAPCGFMLLRVSQYIGGSFQHYLVECYFPEFMKTQFDYFDKNEIEFVAIAADKIMRPTRQNVDGLDVVCALSVNRIERN